MEDEEIDIKGKPLWELGETQFAPPGAPCPSKELRVVLNNFLCSEPLNSTNGDPALHDDQFQTMNVKNYYSKLIQEHPVSDPSRFYNESSLNFEIQHFHQNILGKCQLRELDEYRREYIEELRKVCNLEVLKCMACQYETIHKNNIKLHLFLVHNSSLEYNIWKCKKCDYISTDPTLLKNHVEIHQEQENKMPSTNDDNNISSDDTNADNYSDTETDFEIENVSPTENIKRGGKKRKKELLKCPKCPYTYHLTTSMARHIKRHKDIPCLECDYVASGTLDMLKHKSKHKAEIRQIKTTANYTFQCDKCTFKTNSAYYFENHSPIHKHNIGIKPGLLWQCHECEFQTKNINQLMSHIIKTHREPQKEKYVCEICGRAFDHVHTFRSHKKLSHKTLEELDEVFECFQCGHISKTKTRLKAHIVNKHRKNQPKYVCETCGRETTNKNNHINHLKIHVKTDTPLFNCEKCDYKTNIKKNLVSHTRNGKHLGQGRSVIDRVGPQYHCSVNCKFQCHAWKTIKTHFKKSHPDIPESILKVQLIKKCLKCEFQCSGANSGMAIHNHIVENHFESLSFKCDMCEYKSINFRGLRWHRENKHNKIGSKRFQCEECNYETTNKFVFKEHRRSHQIAVHNYHCLHCDFSTTSKIFLITHLSSHKSERQCPHCPFKTSRRHHYEAHIGIHKKTKNKTLLKCKICSALFKYKQNLNIHIQRSHPNEDSSDVLKCNLCNVYQTKVVQYFQLHLKNTHKLPKLGDKYKEYCTILDGSTIKKPRNYKKWTKTGLLLCKICDKYQSTSRTNFVQHLKRIHKPLLTSNKYQEYAIVVDLNENKNETKVDGASGNKKTAVQDDTQVCVAQPFIEQDIEEILDKKIISKVSTNGT